MDERTHQKIAKEVDDFSSADKRADFWKVRIVRQPIPATKVYLFPSLLEWLNERPHLTLNAALVEKEMQLGINSLEESLGSAEHGSGQNVDGDPLTLYVAGHTKNRPSTQDIDAHLQRSYEEFYKRREHGRSRELVSLIDACILLNETAFAWQISQENNYEHDLLQIYRKKVGKEKWDDYKTTVMLRLSSCGTPSKELWEAATATRLLCDIMAGPTPRRRSALAEMAANGLKLDALVLAKLFFSNDVLCEELTRQCSQLFQKTISADMNDIVGLIRDASAPFFERRMLRCIDQLSCYRILRTDFALNENASLEKKLIGRIELAQHVRFVIADALAYRNFGAVKFIGENAPAHLDRYAFFSGLEQIVYPMAMMLLLEATRIVFHAKPASVGWKKQNDESDKLGLALQQHPNGYIGGLVEMWLNRISFDEIAYCKDIYRQRSLRTSIESIASVLREDVTFNPVCRGLLIFACDLVCTILDAIFGRSCHRLDELIESKHIDYHTGMTLIRKLSKGILSSHANKKLVHVLNQLCPITFSDSSDISSQDNTDKEGGVQADSHPQITTKSKNEHCSDVMEFEFANIPFLDELEGRAAKDMSEPTNSLEKATPGKIVENGSGDARIIRSCNGDCEQPDLRAERCAPGLDCDVAAVSEQSSDQNDVSSVAPSRSVCEQVKTMLAGVKYCKEREMEDKKRSRDIQDDQELTEVARPDVSDVVVTEQESKQSEWEPVDFAKTCKQTSDDNLCSTSQAHHSEEHLMEAQLENVMYDDEEEKKAPIAIVEPVNITACARIISDDHLDFSSRDPSLSTKWLPDDGIPDEKISDSAAAKASLHMRKDSFGNGSNVADDVVGGFEDLPWKDGAVEVHQEREVTAELSRDVDCVKAESVQVVPPPSPVTPSNQYGDAELYHSTVSNEDKTDELRIHVSEVGRESLDKILCECVDLPCLKADIVNNQEGGVVPQNHLSSTQPTAEKLAGFTEIRSEEQDRFPCSRETVFCTSSNMSDVNLSTTSGDDDIAGFGQSSFRIASSNEPVKMIKHFETGATPVSSDVAIIPELEDVIKGRAKEVEVIHVDIGRGDVKPDNGGKSWKLMDTSSSEDRGSGLDNVAGSHHNATEEFNNDHNDIFDTSLRQPALRPIQEKETVEAKETVGHPKPAPAQRKFMLGGFDSGSSSGFGSFGSGHSERENAFGSSLSAGGRRGSFDGERSGCGGGRGGLRGGGRGRGYERDRDASRDDYRDRERRDRHESFRGRSGGYVRSDSRDSQSFEGRGGYRSNRT